jgi:Na+/H+ antiporter NhaC
MLDNITINLTGYNSANVTTIVEEKLVTVHQISFVNVIVNFIVFILSYTLIGYLREKNAKIINPTEDDLHALKTLKFLFKWWPAIYVIIILAQYA